jgi:hypothetical protein
MLYHASHFLHHNSQFNEFDKHLGIIVDVNVIELLTVSQIGQDQLAVTMC